MSQAFQVKHPLPSRRAAEVLRQQIVDHLIETRPAIGEPFLSDHQLARVAGLSRPTVRRALDSLSREGWIERRHGRGTYVGPRAGLGTRSMQVGLASASGAGADDKRLVRMGVLVHGLGDFSNDWYSPTVMAGIDDVAAEAGVTIELVGDRDCDVRAVSARLMQSRPDVLVCLANTPRAVLSREQLLAEVWDWADASGTRTVDSHIKALRRKIGAERIRTVHGVGYALETPAP